MHLNIVKAVKNKKTCIIFTSLSATNNFKFDFEKYSDCLEINNIRNKKNKFIHNLLIKMIVHGINSGNRKKIVFGSNTDFFYQILPKFNNNVRKIDLIHAVTNENHWNKILATSSSFIDDRVVISNAAKMDLAKIYKKYDIPNNLLNNIKIIENGIPVFNNLPHLKNRNKIKFGFIGRWSEEKRPEIFLKIAKKTCEIFPETSFVMVGTGMKSNINLINSSGVDFLGEITDELVLHNLYNSLNFIIITSKSEGFPMVIMEAMIHGVVPITTNVGAISEHIVNYENGIIINDNQDEEIVFNDFMREIKFIIENKKIFEKISNNAFEYAKSKFNIISFNEKYDTLFSD